MPESIIFKGFQGLDNRLDELRHRYNPDTGIGVLKEAVDCDIDDSGMISRRLGQTEISSDPFSTVFCDQGDCFAVQDRASDAAIMKLGLDMTTLTGIRSELTKGAMISFCQVGYKTYYQNGYQSGIIENGVSTAWPGYDHLGADTVNEYYGAPIGTHIAVFDGQMLIAIDNIIWISERYEFGKFRMAKKFFQMGTNIRMMRPVLGGIWLSDQNKTGFVPAGKGPLASAPFIDKSTYPAHEWSDNDRLVDLSESRQISGDSAVWSSDEGLCIGTEDGQLIVDTEEKLIYPTGSSGATIVDGHNVINSVY